MFLPLLSSAIGSAVLVSTVQHNDTAFLQFTLLQKLLMECYKYIRVAYLFNIQTFATLNPLPHRAPSFFPLPTSNHKFVLYIRELLSVLLYTFICFYSFRFHI